MRILREIILFVRAMLQSRVDLAADLALPVTACRPPQEVEAVRGCARAIGFSGSGCHGGGLVGARL